MSPYIGLMHQNETGFSVVLPDFPGCVTSGASMFEAFRLAHEALHLHVQGMREDGESIPEPSALEKVLSGAEHPGGVPFLVALPEDLGRAVRVNVSIPENFLRRIDDHARRHHVSRSAFLVEAAERALSEESA